MSIPPDRVPCSWPSGGKMQAMEAWAGRVMSDHRSSRTELKVAWSLSYSFNSDDGRCWASRAVLAKRAGLSESAVKSALTGLDRNGHIARSTEVIRGKEMRIVRPTLSRSFGMAEPRPRRGGVAKGVDPRSLAADRRRTDLQSPNGTDPQPLGGTDPQAPCIQERSLINPRIDVAGVVTGSDDAWTDWMDDEEDDTIPIP